MGSNSGQEIPARWSKTASLPALHEKHASYRRELLLEPAGCDKTFSDAAKPGQRHQGGSLRGHRARQKKRQEGRPCRFLILRQDAETQSAIRDAKANWTAAAARAVGKYADLATWQSQRDPTALRHHVTVVLPFTSHNCMRVIARSCTTMGYISALVKFAARGRRSS